LLWLNHRPNATARDFYARLLLRGIEGFEGFRIDIVLDVVAVDFVLVALDLGPIEEFDGIRFTVVVDALCVTLDVLLEPVALLAEFRGLTGRGYVDIASIVLSDGDAVRIDAQRSLIDDDVSFEGTFLFFLVAELSISIDLNGFAAIGFFCLSRKRQGERDSDHCENTPPSRLAILPVRVFSAHTSL